MSAAQLPPLGCHTCQRVVVTQTRVLDSVVTRWTCGDGLHMQAHCTGRVPTPYNQRKEPAPCSGV